MRVTSLGLVVRANRKSGDLPRICEALCLQHGIALWACPAAGLSPSLTLPEDQLAGRCDALLVFGGDGTILHAASLTGGKNIPILGVNTGTLGFLSACPPEDLPKCIALLAEGSFRIEERMQLQAVLDGTGERFTALNDIAVTRGRYSRVLDLTLLVDGEPAMQYRGDGILAATPTGSTAYSLAAGGTLVDPRLSCILLTPVCPHSFSVRPVIIPADLSAEIRVGLRAPDGGAEIAVDGLCRMTLNASSTITVSRSPSTVSLIRIGDARFFHTVREKFSAPQLP